MARTPGSQLPQSLRQTVARPSSRTDGRGHDLRRRLAHQSHRHHACHAAAHRARTSEADRHRAHAYSGVPRRRHRQHHRPASAHAHVWIAPRPAGCYAVERLRGWHRTGLHGEGDQRARHRRSLQRHQLHSARRDRAARHQTQAERLRRSRTLRATADARHGLSPTRQPARPYRAHGTNDQRHVARHRSRSDIAAHGWSNRSRGVVHHGERSRTLRSHDAEPR